VPRSSASQRSADDHGPGQRTLTARARLALTTMLLMVVVAVAYAPTSRGVLVWDDHPLLATTRAMARRPLGDLLFQPFWTADPMSDARPAYYRPLVVWSYRFDLALDPDDPAALHRTNLALHLLATAALVALARRLGASANAAILATGTWALAPRLTESVAWISGRTDVLALVLGLAAMGAWPWYGRDEPRSRAAWLRAALASALLLLALLAKEVALACAAAMVVGTIAGRRIVPRAAAREAAARIAPIALVTAVYFAMRTSAMNAARPTTTPLGTSARAATVLEAIGRYVRMTLDPWHPASSIGLVGEVDTRYAVFGGSTVALACVAAAVAVRRARARGSERTGVKVGAAVGVAALAPVLHVAPIGLAAAVAADRLLYVPLAGLALALACAANDLAPRRRLPVALLVSAIALSFVPFTFRRAGDYTDEVLFRVVAVEDAHPLNTSARSGLANVLRDHHEPALACRVHASSRRILERTGRTGTPRHTRALENLASCLAFVGQYEAAGAVYATLAASHSDSARVHMELGFFALHRGDLDAAEAAFRRALSLEPALTPARRALADIPGLRGDVQRFADESVRRERLGEWAIVLSRLGRRPEAIAAWSELALRPDVSLADATTAVDVLLSEADLATARRAVEAFTALHGPDAEKLARLERRVAEKARVDAVRARIDALTAD